MFDNGNIIEAEYVDNKLNGKGKVIYANDNTYEGEYKDDKRHGIGVYK